MKFKKILIILVCASFMGLSSPDIQPLPETRKITFEGAIGTFVAFPSILHNMCHEFGHALAARVLNNDPMDIHIGVGGEETIDDVFQKSEAEYAIYEGEYLFKLGPITFHKFRGGGYTLDKKTNDNIKEALILINGPLFGFLASLFLHKYFLKKFSNQISSKNYKFITFLLIANNLLDVLHELVDGFTPLSHSKDSDGYKLWKLIDKKEKYICSIQSTQENFGRYLLDAAEILCVIFYCKAQLDKDLQLK